MFKSFREIMHFIGGLLAMTPFFLHFIQAIDLNKLVNDISNAVTVNEAVIEDVVEDYNVIKK